MNEDAFIEVLGQVEPSKVAAYLEEKSFELINHSNGVMLFESVDGGVVLLPESKDFIDYPRKVYSILSMFSEGKTTVDDILQQIVFPKSDVLRYSVGTPESKWGQLRVQYTYQMLQALHHLVQYTAAGIVSGRQAYTKISDHAKAFSSQCRFGQTEFGSYVVKMYCPQSPVGVTYTEEDDEPYGRIAVRAAIENVSFLSSGLAEDPEEPLPPTMNRQVAGAVIRLKPPTHRYIPSKMSVDYTASAAWGRQSVMRQVRERECVSVEFSPLAFAHAQSVKDRFKKEQEFELEKLEGEIIILHKERPQNDSDQSHEITVHVKYGGGRRQLRVKLLPSLYAKALKWHAEDRTVIVSAVVDKRGKVWSVYKLNSIKPKRSRGASDYTGAGGGTLFD